MATIETFKVNKGLKYLVKARKVGYYDYAQVFGGTEEDTSVSVPAMTPYDGLSMTQVNNYKCADIVDFTNTILPWKWDYEKYLSTSKFALMPVGDYKYSIYNYDNTLTKVGNVSIDNTIASGFSASNYLKLTTNFASNAHNGAWCVYTKVVFTELNKINAIFGGASGTYLPDFFVNENNVMSVNLSSNGSAYDIVEATVTGTTAVELGKTYWLKYGWTGTEYYGELSTNGKDYNREFTITSSTAIESTTDPLFIGYRIGAFFSGKVDLLETKIEYYNGTVWNGLEKFYIDNINFVGSPTFNAETMVASNFSTSNYITTPVFNPANNPWEVRIKFTTGSDFTATTSPVIFSSAYNNGNKGINLNFFHSSNHEEFNLYVSHNGSNWLFDVWGTHKVQLNTTYWVRFGWTGVEYYLDYSTNGKDYIRDITYESSVAAHTLGSNSVTCIGTSSQKTSPFNGSIDLSETELLINGETFYKPEVTYLTQTIQGCTHNYTDTGQATTLNCFTVNGDERVILTPDTSYNNERFLGTVNIAEHDVYDYVDGEWIEK
jgi:hypothetical protein